MDLRETLEIMRYRHVIVLLSYALGAFALTSGELSSIRLLEILFGGFCLFASTYGYNYITDIEEDTLNKRPNPLSFINKNVYIRILLIFAVLGLLISYVIGTFTLVLAIIILIVGYSYSHGRIRFKRYGWLKTIILTFSWFLMFIYLSSAFSNISTVKILLVAVFFSTLSLCGMILRDIPDIEGDRKAGIRTVPILMGVKNTGLLMLTITLFQYAMLFSLLVIKSIPPLYLSLIVVLPLRGYLSYAVIKEDIKRAFLPSILSYPLTGVMLLISEAII
ncbi:MAG: UbiA family prenyltransferase [Candidatus Altiarchaeota archaeon]